jgi:hypothetical protein
MEEEHKRNFEELKKSDIDLNEFLEQLKKRNIELKKINEERKRNFEERIKNDEYNDNETHSLCCIF